MTRVKVLHPMEQKKVISEDVQIRSFHTVQKVKNSAVAGKDCHMLL